MEECSPKPKDIVVDDEQSMVGGRRGMWFPGLSLQKVPQSAHEKRPNDDEVPHHRIQRKKYLEARYCRLNQKPHLIVSKRPIEGAGWFGIGRRRTSQKSDSVKMYLVTIRLERRGEVGEEGGGGGGDNYSER